MKRTLSILLMLVLAVSLLSSCTEGNKTKPGIATTNDPNAETVEGTPDSDFTFVVPDTTVSEGDSFSVFINLDNKDWTWDSFSFVITYDPEIIKINKVNTTEETADMLNLSNLEHMDNAIKLAFADALEHEGGGDIAEIECEALKAGSFEMAIKEEYASREVTYKADNKKNIVAIEKVKTKSGTITVEEVKQAQAETHPVFTAQNCESKVGETFTVKVDLSNIEQWDSFELVLTYDNSLVKVLGVNATEITKNMLNITKTDYTENSIKLAFASAEELTETGTVVEIEFEAVAEGEFELVLSEPFMSVEIDGEVTDVGEVQTVNAGIVIK